MSTAIMQQSSMYDFGDLLLKNQSQVADHLSRTRLNSTPPFATMELRQALGRVAGIAPHRRLERAVSDPTPPTPPPPPPNASRYKTELCRPFEEAGSCKYGDKCQFAHGVGELRNLQRHPKYKTELCRTFHSIGFCPYGPRCHFVHNSDESRSRSSLPSSPTGSASPLSRSPTESVSSFFPASTSSPQVSPRTSPLPSLDDSRLPVFNHLMKLSIV